MYLKKKDDIDIATGVNYGVASSSSLSKSICNPETDIRELEGHRRLAPPFKGEYLAWTGAEELACISPPPKDKPIGGRVHRK